MIELYVLRPGAQTLTRPYMRAVSYHGMGVCAVRGPHRNAQMQLELNQPYKLNRPAAAASWA